MWNELFRAMTLVVLVTLSMAQVERVGAAPSISEIQQGIMRIDRALFERESLRIVYALDHSEDVNPTKMSGGLFLTEWEIAHLGGKAWYVRWRFPEQKVRVEGVRLEKEPVYAVAKDGLSLFWMRDNGRCMINPVDSNIGYMNGWHFIRYAGINVYRHIAASTWNDMARLKDEMRGESLLETIEEPLLPDALDTHREKYVVRSEPELVDGTSCIVLEWPGMDKIWVDPNRGFAVIRRIVHWSPDAPRKYDVLNRNLKEVQPDVWLPSQQIVDHYTKISADPKDVWDKVACRSTYNLKSIAFDADVSDLFNVQPPVGTYVDDYARNVRYRIRSEGASPFEVPSGQVPGSSYLRITLIVLNVAVACFLFVWIWRRRRLAAGVIAVFSLIGTSLANSSEVSGCCPAGVYENVRNEVHVAAENRADNTDVWKDSDTNTFFWAESYRSSADCGPLALFALLDSMGRDADIETIKARVPCDPKLGTTLQDLCDGSAAMGIPTEVHFVVPSKLSKIPCPYILHRSSGVRDPLGHFVVIVSVDSASWKKFGVLDPVRGRFEWLTEGQVYPTFSGYVLVPSSRLSRGKVDVALAVLPLTMIVYVAWRRMRPHPTSRINKSLTILNL